MSPTTRAEQKERTRAAILDAAEAAFADLGFAGARVDAIARRVGIQRASLFHHFPDKSALYSAVIEHRVMPYFEQVRRLLEQGEQPTGSAAQLDLIVQGVSLQADFFARNPRIAKIFLREITDFDVERPSPLAELIHPLVDRVARFLEAKQREGLCDPVDAEHIVSAVAGSALLQVVARPILHPAKPGRRPSPFELEQHKEKLAGLVERLLGIDRPSTTARAAL